MSEQLPPESPRAWLQRARSDLALARAAVGIPDVLLEDVCFHAQQCAEKALKALLIWRQVAFPRTHVLETLLDLLKVAGVRIPSEVDEAFVLTQYAVQTRYPGEWEPITTDEAHSALETAARVLAWVESQLDEAP
jgi:HEPN domain-containing protein